MVFYGLYIRDSLCSGCFEMCVCVGSNELHTFQTGRVLIMSILNCEEHTTTHSLTFTADVNIVLFRVAYDLRAASSCNCLSSKPTSRTGLLQKRF